MPVMGGSRPSPGSGGASGRGAATSPSSPRRPARWSATASVASGRGWTATPRSPPASTNSGRPRPAPTVARGPTNRPRGPSIPGESGHRGGGRQAPRRDRRPIPGRVPGPTRRDPRSALAPRCPPPALGRPNPQGTVSCFGPSPALEALQGLERLAIAGDLDAALAACLDENDRLGAALQTLVRSLGPGRATIGRRRDPAASGRGSSRSTGRGNSRPPGAVARRGRSGPDAGARDGRPGTG